MIKRMNFLFLLTFTLLVTSACSNSGDAVSSSNDSASTQAAESASESIASAPESAIERATVLSEILQCEPGDLIDFTYFDTPELYKRKSDGSVFPANGAMDITYNCGVYEGP